VCAVKHSKLKKSNANLAAGYKSLRPKRIKLVEILLITLRQALGVIFPRL